jgi:DNA-directed RNA polymerase specialized sigma24 family protein
MDELENLDRRGRELLAELAENPDSDCWRQFDAIFYEIVWRYLRVNSDRLGTRVARYLGITGTVAPNVLRDEVDEVAHDATTIALRRVREKASQFNPARGTPTRWVIGAAEFAYTEVAKAVVGARRSAVLEFRDPDDLLGFPDTNPTTEEHVVRRIGDEQALAAAARVLSERELTAIRLVVTLEFSYAEAAQVIYGDAGMGRQVEWLLTRGKRLLAEAWGERHESASSTGASKLSGSAAENRRDDE